MFFGHCPLYNKIIRVGECECVCVSTCVEARGRQINSSITSLFSETGSL